MITIKPEKAPTHTVYWVKTEEGSTRPQWNKVSNAWEHADKQGLNFRIKNQGEYITLTIRKNKPKAE